MKFFCDNNIPPKIAKIIKIIAEPHYEVVHLEDMFPKNISDEDWMNAIKNKGFVVITGDYRITSRQHEKKALMESNLTVFILGKGLMNINIWKQASKILGAFQDVITSAKENPHSCIFEIDRNSKVVLKQKLDHD